MVEFPLQWGINHGQKLLDTPTLLPMLSIKCLQRSVPQGQCPHVPLYPTQTPLAGHAWLPCWKAQRCWPCSSCQPLLDPLLVPLISTWATFSSLGPHQELASSQLTHRNSLPLPLRFSCCVLLETMGQTASLPKRQTCSPKVDLTFSLSISPAVCILHEGTRAQPNLFPQKRSLQTTVSHFVNQHSPHPCSSSVSSAFCNLILIIFHSTW